MVKLNLTEVGGDSGPTIDLGEAIEVFASHSKSSPGSFHFTVALAKPAIFKRFGGEVTILCSCRGFQNHRKCWHVEEMKFRVSEAAPVEGEQEFEDPDYCKHLDLVVQRNEGVRWVTCTLCGTDFYRDYGTELEHDYHDDVTGYPVSSEDLEDDGGIGFSNHDHGDKL